MFRYKQFPYRRVYNITVCREVEIKTDDAYRSYRIHIKYDLDRLLHIAYINPDYARYRIKELAKLKRFFTRQDMIGSVYLDYFVSANILLIKSVIVGKYLRLLINREEEAKKQDIFNGFIKMEDVVNAISMDMLIETKLYTEIKNVCVRLLKVYGAQMYQIYVPRGMDAGKSKAYEAQCKEYFWKTFYIYTFVHLLIFAGETINTKGLLKGEELGEALQRLLDRLIQDKTLADNDGILQNLSCFCSEEVMILLKDCCVQAGRWFSNLDNYSYYPNSYFLTYHSKEVLYSTVKRFTDTERYCPMGEKEGKMQLDAYSDLYAVREMLRELMEYESAV